MAVLDTNLLVDLLRRRPVPRTRHAENLIRAMLSDGEPLMTTRINVAELYVGAEISADPSGEEARIDRLLKPFQILEFDAESARAYGRIQATPRRTGRPAGDMDALIAAISIRHGQRLITRNHRHFVGIPGLSVTPVS